MAKPITLDALLGACADDGFDDGIRIDTELEPIGGPGGSVKPAVYEGGKYQRDQRWASPDDQEPTPVIVIDNVASQANRLEDALRRYRDAVGIPELLLDLSALESLPVHLPRRISSLQFPHRNADAYLRDARLDDEDFIRTPLGKAIFGATAQTCGPLMAWFPQALIYGFWQSHLGKKRQNTKHPRAWVSEIVGWHPASRDTRTLGLKGDPLNLTSDAQITVNTHDQLAWEMEPAKSGDGGDRLSEIGHGQILFMRDDPRKPLPAAAVSFARVSQRATISFAQLRRVSLGQEHLRDGDAAARALLVALGLHAHVLAFGQGFALRSGAELRPVEARVKWLGGTSDEDCTLGDVVTSRNLLSAAREYAGTNGVPLDGWGAPPTMLSPSKKLSAAIRNTWPILED